MALNLSENNFMKKRLKDFEMNKQIKRPVFEVLPMDFKDNEATKRIVTHTVKRIIKQHKEEFQNLAYK